MYPVFSCSMKDDSRALDSYHVLNPIKPVDNTLTAKDMAVDAQPRVIAVSVSSVRALLSIAQPAMLVPLKRGDKCSVVQSMGLSSSPRFATIRNANIQCTYLLLFQITHARQVTMTSPKRSSEEVRGNHHDCWVDVRWLYLPKHPPPPTRRQYY